MDRLSQQIERAVSEISETKVFGRVTKILGLLVEIAGVSDVLAIGSRVNLKPNNGEEVPCEVIGFRDEQALLMPFGTLDGIGLGCVAVIQPSMPSILPNDQWLGRVINGMAQPIDGKGPLQQGGLHVPLKNKPPPPHSR